MNQAFLKGIMSVALAGAMASCAFDFGSGPSSTAGMGSIALTATVDGSTVTSRSRAEDEADIGVSQLGLRLTPSDGSQVYSWESVDDFDSEKTFPAGSYTIEAFYGDEKSKGFEAPHYYGSTTLEVKDGQTTPVALEATLANAKVKVNFSDNFVNYMQSFSAAVYSAGADPVTITASEKRPVYVREGNVEVTLDLTKPNGTKGHLSVATFQARPRYFYTVNIDVTNGSADVALSVTFDETLDTETIVIDLSDDVLNAPGPEFTAEGFDPSEPISFVDYNAPSDLEARLTVVAMAGLRSLKLYTESASLTASRWPSAEIDLLAAATDLGALGSMGLKTVGIPAAGSSEPARIVSIDMSALIASLRFIDGDAADNVSTFTLRAVDTNSKESETPLKFTVAVDPISLELSNGQYKFGAQTITFDVAYNGADLSKEPWRVAIFYLNPRGTLTAASAVEYVLDGDVYHATATIDPQDEEVEIVAVPQDQRRVSLTVTPEVPLLIIDTDKAVDAFARFAFVPVKVDGEESTDLMLRYLMNGADLLISTDGNTFTDYDMSDVIVDTENAVFILKTLEPSTEYFVKIVNADKHLLDSPQTAQFTTADEWQLPNSGMEYWSAHDNTSYSYFTWQEPDDWMTANSVTAGGASRTSEAFKYCPGTSSSTDDAFAGSCAQITTVGHGSGNNIPMTGLGSYTVQHLTVGELYYGEKGVGAAVVSRPTALSFRYKYSKFNAADWGTARVVLYDASGDVLYDSDSDQSVSTPLNSLTATDYELVTVPLKNFETAARIYVEFTSSGNEALHAPSNTNLKYPSTGLSKQREKFLGSSLFIDDIELHYEYPDNN